MENNQALATPAKNVSGLDSVRAQAQRQGRVRFSRAFGSAAKLSDSFQQIRTLKSIAAEAEREPVAEAELAPLSLLGKLWGAFQEAIGNR